MSRLSHLKKKLPEGRKNMFVPHLVVGRDYSSLRLVQLLREKHGAENVKLLSSSALDERELFFRGPSYLRGNFSSEEYQALKEKFSELLSGKSPTDALFYKDQKLRSFSGRTKPYKLLGDEGFFSLPKIELDYEYLYDDQLKALFAQQDSFVIQKELGQITTSLGQQDLIEKSRWDLLALDNSIISCEQIYWGRNLFDFYQLFEPKNQLSDEFIAICEKVQTPYGLIVEFESDLQITQSSETLLIPQSQTHDWGHFIGEFSKFDDNSGKQRFVFMCFVDKDNSSEDELGKKIRLLKNNLKRIFPIFAKASTQEFITLTRETPCLEFDKEGDFLIDSEFENLSIFGSNTPLENLTSLKSSFAYSKFDITSTMRSLISLEQFL